jgi:phenylalanyl-tRNA synthetase alpha subunit
MLDKIDALRKTIANELAELTSAEQREAFRIRYLGRKGEVAELFKQLKDVAAEQKREVGQELNKLKQWVEAEFGQGNKQDARVAGKRYRPHPSRLYNPTRFTSSAQPDPRRYQADISRFWL